MSNISKKRCLVFKENHAKAFVAAIFSTVVVGGAAYAETMECMYKGKWNMSGGIQGDVSWAIRYVGGGVSWSASGMGDDSYGPSTISGSCNDRRCALKQVYSGGSAQGSIYNFVGDYTDKQGNNGMTETSFTGTWKGSDGNSGSWSAKGNCLYK